MTVKVHAYPGLNPKSPAACRPGTRTTSRARGRVAQIGEQLGNR